VHKPDPLFGFPSHFLIWDSSAELSPNWYLRLLTQKSVPHPHLHEECIMSDEPISIPIERYIAIDAHKTYVRVGGLNARQETVLAVRRVPIENYPGWVQANLRPGDAVVIEATTNTWTLYDVTQPYVSKVVVAHPLEVKQIANARVKTDKQDVNCLARLLVADLVPEVWVPPMEVRELRTLIAHRRRLVKMHTMTANRLHSVIHRNNLVPPEGGFFTPTNRGWWEALSLSTVERLQVRQNLAMLDHLVLLTTEIDQELARLSTTAPWSGHAPYLLQLPGFGLINTMTVLSAIGDITRFPTSKKLVGYSGLGGSVHDSGQTHATGPITKQGRKELRWTLVEAAWRAVEHHPFWKQEFQKLNHRMKSSKAIVAIARRLLVVIWHVMTERVADRKADPSMVAFKLMKWSWQLNDWQRSGLTTRQFVRYHLMRLKLGDELTRIQRAHSIPLASVEEVLALKPELRPNL
jgi:transposase